MFSCEGVKPKSCLYILPQFFEKRKKKVDMVKNFCYNYVNLW